MCFHDDCVRPFDAWSHSQLTVVTEAFPSVPSQASTREEPDQPQVYVNLRFSTGRDQALLRFHKLDQVKILAGAISEMLASVDQVLKAGTTEEPILIAKTVAAVPIKI